MVDGMLIPLASKPGHFSKQFFDCKSNYSLSLMVSDQLIDADPQVVCMIPWHLKNLVCTKSPISYSQMASGYGQIQHTGCLCHVLFLTSYHSPWYPLTASSAITSQWYEHVIIDIHEF